MVGILDLISNDEANQFIQDLDYPLQNGALLFPEVKQDSIEMEYIMGANGVPVSASVHAYDTEAEIGSREAGLNSVKQRLAFIKRKYQVNEELMLRLNSLRTSSPAYNSIVDSIYNDIEKSYNAVMTRIERMRYEALATGKITLAENGVNYVIDYQLDADNQFTDLSNKWDTDATRAIEDIFDVTDKMIAQGSMPSRILTSRRVLATILRDPAVQEMVTGTRRILTEAEFNQFLGANQLPQIGTEDRVFRVENADGTTQTQRYFPDNTMVFLPSEPVGRTVYAPTPEEIQLFNDPSVDSRNIGNVSVVNYTESKDPVGEWTKASASVLPSFERANEVHIATVLNPQG